MPGATEAVYKKLALTKAYVLVSFLRTCWQSIISFGEAQKNVIALHELIRNCSGANQHGEEFSKNSHLRDSCGAGFSRFDFCDLI